MVHACHDMTLGGGVMWWLTRWSRSTKLLYIGPGYYSDGWLSAGR